MTTVTLTLTDFLLARIAEDEAVARAVVVADFSEGRWGWSQHNPGAYRTFLANDRGAVVLPPKNDDVYPSHMVAAHIARHDPARVLAECEAKRRIVDLHKIEPVSYSCPCCRGDHGVNGWTCEGCDAASTILPMCDTLLALATIYADHPDYRRDEWWRG